MTEQMRIDIDALGTSGLKEVSNYINAKLPLVEKIEKLEAVIEDLKEQLEERTSPNLED